MDKWEYLVRRFDYGSTITHPDVQDRMNELGQEGWECFAFSKDTAFFKRKLKNE